MKGNSDKPWLELSEKEQWQEVFRAQTIHIKALWQNVFAMILTFFVASWGLYRIVNLLQKNPNEAPLNVLGFICGGLMVYLFFVEIPRTLKTLRFTYKQRYNTENKIQDLN